MREAQAKQLHLEGHTQHDIAKTLNVSQPAVSKMLKRIEERLLADVAWRVDRQRARQTLRLEFIYKQAIAGWRASQEEGMRRRRRKVEGPGTQSGTTVAELISENRNGDPRFLDEARRALGDLRALWGVDAPERLSVDATNRFAVMSDADIEAELARQSVFLGRFLPAQGETVPAKRPADES
jgi:DNA-binding Lrp family transcriptional regulator